jgi:hypothetical protein
MSWRKPAGRFRAWLCFFLTSLVTGAAAILLRLHVFGSPPEAFDRGEAHVYAAIIAAIIVFAANAGYAILLLVWRSLTERDGLPVYTASAIAGVLAPPLCVFLSMWAPKAVTLYSPGPVAGALFYFILLLLESLLLSAGLIFLVTWVFDND